VRLRNLPQYFTREGGLATAASWRSGGNVVICFTCAGAPLHSGAPVVFCGTTAVMTDIAITSLLWFCAIGSALIAGLFFAFSTFIMTALGRIAPPAGIVAMNAINEDILRSLFMPVFFATTLGAAALAAIAPFRWNEPGAAAMLAGGGIYVLGMFVCTMVANVPLNNQLAAVAPDNAEAKSTWARYLKHWTLWNHVRTVSSTVACALFIAAIAAR
jgi:uncharacterized membrane protein